MDNAISRKQGQQYYIRSLKLWVIQKNIEAEEKWAQKREELEKKIKKNNLA